MLTAGRRPEVGVTSVAVVRRPGAATFDVVPGALDDPCRETASPCVNVPAGRHDSHGLSPYWVVVRVNFRYHVL